MSSKVEPLNYLLACVIRGLGTVKQFVIIAPRDGFNFAHLKQPVGVMGGISIEAVHRNGDGAAAVNSRP